MNSLRFVWNFAWVATFLFSTTSQALQHPLLDHSARARIDRDLRDQLGMPEKCVPQSKSIAFDLEAYDKAPSGVVAQARLNDIYNRLDRAGDCFDSLATFTALEPPEHGFSEIDFLARLYKAGRLKPVSRAEKQRATGWTNAKNGILGAYDCLSTTIYFDPYHGPRDEAALLEHERSHLLRDKFSSKLIPQGAPRLTAVEYAIADEIVSMIAGGVAEMGSNAWQNKSYDVTLYNQSGDLAGILRDMGELNDQEHVLGFPFGDPSEYLRNAALLPKSEVRFRRIIEMAASAYAPGVAYREDLILAWLQLYDTGPVELWGTSAEIYKAIENSSYETFSEFISRPSPACRAFTKNLSSGALNGYLGASVGVPDESSDKKTQPGTEGTKPTNNTQPGTEGTKPSRIMQPGTEGTKPGLSTLRPCVGPAPGF